MVILMSEKVINHTVSKEKLNERIIETISDSDTDGYMFISLNHTDDSNEINFIPFVNGSVEVLMGLLIHCINAGFKYLSNYPESQKDIKRVLEESLNLIEGKK